MAFSQLLYATTVDACRGADASKVGVVSGIGAATMVLVMSVLPPANWAYYCFLVFAAALRCMVKRPAALALLDEGV